MNNLKQIEREKIKEKLKQFSLKEKNKYDKKIFEKLISLKIYSSAKEIFTYVSFDKEVDTINIIDFSLKNGKKVYVPKIIKSTKILKIFQINSINELQTGIYKIPEPFKGSEVRKKEFDLLLIPGLAFDKSCFRLGRGEGYFDRFLTQIVGYKVGLCFAFQVKKRLPIEEHDIRMDMIITENQIYTCNCSTKT